MKIVENNTNSLVKLGDYKGDFPVLVRGNHSKQLGIAYNKVNVKYLHTAESFFGEGGVFDVLPTTTSITLQNT